MRRFFIAMSVVVQISVLAYMAGYREFIILKGKTVFLRTMPVDPSDPFRGDYVSLEYEISVIGKKDLKSGFPANKGEVFYTVLKEEENGLFSLEYCSKEKPSQGELFIKGRYEYDWNFRGQSENFRLKYGIEKYFVQEDKGIEIEERAGIGDQMHIPLEVEVSVGKIGTAVAKGYRWSKLGIGLKVLQAPENQMDERQQNEVTQNQRKSPKLRLTLKNASNENVALVNLPDFGSFELINSEMSSNTWTFSKSSSPRQKPLDDDVILLKPGGKFEVDFDFALPRWFVHGKNASGEIGVVANQWEDTFRIVYRPPSQEECQNLNLKDSIWHGRLQSRRFGTERID